MNHDEWDRQIREAMRIELPADRVARLEAHWRRQSTADRRRRAWRVVAVAASVLIAAAMGILYARLGLDRGAVGNDIARDIAPPVERANPQPRDVAVVPPPEPSLSAGRPATAYETLVFLSRKKGPVALSPSAPPADVKALIDQFANGAGADAARIAEAAGLTVADTEKMLIRHLLRADDDTKRGVMRLLAVCGTTRSSPALLRIARRQDLREPALSTIERIVGIEQLAAQLDATANQPVRTALIGRMLAADSQAALRNFLALVDSAATRGEALAAADSVEHLPVAALLGLLDDDEQSVRMSSALVLGHVNGQEVSQALVDRVAREPGGSVEAWIALLACRGELAEGFISYASRSPRLIAHVNGAHAHWLRLVQ